VISESDECSHMWTKKQRVTDALHSLTNDQGVTTEARGVLVHKTLLLSTQENAFRHYCSFLQFHEHRPNGIVALSCVTDF